MLLYLGSPKRRLEMFELEENGYNKNEVDVYISRLKAELMQKKLSLLSSEQKVLDLEQKQDEVEQKEKNLLKVLKAIEEANKVQEESSKNLAKLISRKNALLEEKIDDFIDYLKENYSKLLEDKEVIDKIDEIEDMMSADKEDEKVAYENTSMKVLLSKMRNSKKEPSKTVKVERTNMHIFDNAENVEEFLSTDPQSDELYKNVAIESNSFDLKEAVNPKDDLDEIMKAFDFFGNDE